MSSSPEGIYESGIVDPGVPGDKYTQPFWLSEPSSISDLQSPWVNDADIVVIGSGITSASLCRSLLKECQNLRIVVLEARSICSGATGRNGGHCKAMSPGVWIDRKAQHGIDEAVRIMEFEHNHLKAIADCIGETRVNCDFQEVEGLDVYYDEKVWKRALDAVKDMQKCAPSLGARYQVYSSKGELEQRNIGGGKAIGAIGMLAGTMWLYKFVTGLFEHMGKSSNLNIQTHTVVRSVTDSSNEDHASIHTNRGTIRARKVVHATNGWMGHLLQELRPFVSPVRANVQRQVPSTSFDTKLTGRYSFWLRYGEHEYDYLIQRPDSSFVLGRANTGRRATTDDKNVDLAPQSHLRGATPLVFNMGAPLTLTHAWSGPVAFTDDHSAFVGKVPGRPHQWVCAAYQGIGMVTAFRAAQGLAESLVGKNELPEDYPRSIILDEKRFAALQKVSKSKL